MMYQTIDNNFNLHANKIPKQTDRMYVFHSDSLSYVDAGLSCDTFNILHIHQNTTTDQELLSAVHYYKERNLDYCIWVNDENLTDDLKAIFKENDIECQGEELGMVLDLENYMQIKNELHKNIAIVNNEKMLSEYSNVIASHWNPKDENVVAFYDKTSSHYLNSENRIELCVYYHNSIPAATVELFPTDENTIGIYGLATLEEFRGNGIGSALMSFVLNIAKQKGYKYIILQATEDGFGIYQNLGFKTHTTYYEFV